MSTANLPTGARLLGRGRWADVYDLGNGRVLRRYRDPAMDASYEAAVLRHVHAAGVPVPEVYDAGGPDIVMQALHGPTMLADLARRPWLVQQHASTLARLHHAVHVVPPADWMRPMFGGEGAVLHLDLHPDNVIITTDGPMIIDWQGAGRGPVVADAALAWVVMSTADVPGPRLQRLIASAGQELFARLFLAACDPRPSTEHLIEALQARLGDVSLLPGEDVRVQHRLDRLRAAVAQQLPP